MERKNVKRKKKGYRTYNREVKLQVEVTAQSGGSQTKLLYNSVQKKSTLNNFPKECITHKIKRKIKKKCINACVNKWLF